MLSLSTFALNLSLLASAESTPPAPVTPPKPKTGWSATMGSYGSLSRGNSDFLEVGAKSLLKHDWASGNKLIFKGETYYWKSYQYDGLKGEGSGRYEHQIIPHFKLFGLSAAKMDEKKKVSLDLEESGGISFELANQLFLETRTGYGFSDKKGRAVEHQWLAGHGLYYYTNITDYLTFSAEGVFLYPLYTSRLKKFAKWNEGWAWMLGRIQVPIQKHFDFYVEVENSYYIPKYAGTKHFDMYTRFGFDVWF